MSTALVIEDDLHTTLLICTLLQRHGFQTLTSDNVMEALSVLENQADIALTILDILLPGPSGINVLDFLQSEYPEIAVLIVSAHLDADPAALTHIGDTPYLSKPFSKQEFDDAINRLGVLDA